MFWVVWQSIPSSTTQAEYVQQENLKPERIEDTRREIVAVFSANFSTSFAEKGTMVDIDSGTRPLNKLSMREGLTYRNLA